MKTMLKIMAGILLLLLVLAVGLNIFFTDERLKRTAMPYLNDTVGREVQVEEMSLSFWRTFPRPGLSVVNLSVPGEAPGDTVMALDRLVLGVELFPLFRSTVNVTEVHLTRPRFRYHVHENGSTNLDFFFADTSGGSAGWSVSIPYFRVDGGRLSYVNDSTDTGMTLSGLGGNLSLRYDSLITSTADLQAEEVSAASGGETWLAGVPLSLTQQSVVNTGAGTLRLQEGSLSLRGFSLQLQGTVSRWSTGPDLDLTFTSSTDNFGELLALLPADYVEGLETRGSLALEGSVAGSMANGAVPDFQASVEVRNGYIKNPDLPGAIEEVRLTARADNTSLTLTELTARAGENTLRASGILDDPLEEDGVFNVDLEAHVNLATVPEFYEIGTLGLQELGGQLTADLTLSGPPSDPSRMEPGGTVSLTNVHLSGEQLPHPVRQLTGELQLTPVTATLNRLSFDLGESQISMNGTMDRYRSWLLPPEERTAPPRLEGTLRSNYIDMDQWIDWDDTSSTPVPIHLPRLDSEVDAQVSRMKLTGVTLSEVRGRLTGSPGQIRLAEGSARLLGGRMTGSITWNVPRPDRTEIIFEGALDSLQAAAFFREYPVMGPSYRFGEYLQGGFNASVSYRSELDEFLTPVLPTTSMSGRFGMTRTRLEGHPVQQRLADMLDRNELRTATLDEWTSSFHVDSSVLSVDSLRLTSGNIGAEINGTRNLADGSVNLQLMLYLPDRYRDAVASVVTTQAVEALTRENGALMLPLRVTGTISRPTISPDRETIQPILQNFLKENAGSVLRKLFDNRQE